MGIKAAKRKKKSEEDALTEQLQVAEPRIGLHEPGECGPRVARAGGAAKGSEPGPYHGTENLPTSQAGLENALQAHVLPA